MKNSNEESWPEEVLQFWFGELAGDAAFPEEKAAKWFNGGEEFNGEVERRFGRVVESAKAGRLDSWAASPHGRLALIIVLDQFPRNIFDDPRVFESDAKALALAKEGIERGDDQKLRPVEAVFFYMPFQHSENLDDQEQGIRLYTALVERSPAAIQFYLENALDYMKRHHAIIKRFGHFPHRNAILGRPSTPEELEFLKQPGSSF